jgi:ActR/RegA family two-component response regulator
MTAMTSVFQTDQSSPVSPDAGRADQSLPRVLCVDDDERLLAGLALRLRRHFEVTTATSAVEALARLDLRRPFAAVVSDMRMPQNDGVSFLSALRRVAPETTRLLLTGQADVASAIAAVNEGEVFRFLLKPIETPALVSCLNEAVARHHEVLEQRRQTEDLVAGVTRLLMLPLSLHSTALGFEADRVRLIVADVTAVVCPRQQWSVELATVAANIACMALSPELVNKWKSRVAMNTRECERVNHAIHRCLDIMRLVPPMHDACEALALLAPIAERPGEWRPPLNASIPARVLYFIMSLEGARLRGHSVSDALVQMRRGAADSDAALINAMAGARLGELNGGRALGEVEVGQRIVSEVRLANGLLFLPAAHLVTDLTVEMIRVLDAESQQTRVYVLQKPPTP